MIEIDAGLERARDAQRLGAVARPDRAREAVDRVVGQLDRLRLVAERDDHGDRPEDLLGRRRGRSARPGTARSAGTSSPGPSGALPRIATGAPSGTKEATVSRWPAEISGPISVASSSGSPTLIASTTSSNASMKASSAERSTRMRERAQQSWPALPNTAPGAAAAAAWMSASANTTLADLPPSSSVTRLIVCAAPAAIVRPTSVEPVNATLATSGCSTSRCPQVRPGPATTLTTPSGIPAPERDPLELERGQRRQLGRLEHDRVAGRERRRELPRGDREREVPRRDQRRPRRAARGRSCRRRRPRGSCRRGCAPARPRSSGRCRPPSASRRARRRSACRRCAPRAPPAPRARPRARRPSRCSSAARSPGATARHAG